MKRNNDIILILLLIISNFLIQERILKRANPTKCLYLQMFSLLGILPTLCGHFSFSFLIFPRGDMIFFFRHSFVQLLNTVFFLQIHSKLHRFWSKILCIYKRFSLRGHFLLSLPNFFQEEKWVFFPDITLSCSPNCLPQFFYKFIYNCIVFEAKFFVYTKGSHYADIFSSLFPIFFRRRNEFSFQTLLCLVLLIAHHNFSTNSFTIASFLK